MSFVDPANQIGAMLRSVLTRQRTTGKAPPQHRASQARSHGDKAASLQHMLIARTRAIPVDDPERNHKVLRAFLEANFLAEFGEQLANEPAFGRMVSEVQAQMEGDVHLAEALQEVVQTLLGTSVPKT